VIDKNANESQLTENMIKYNIINNRFVKTNS